MLYSFLFDSNVRAIVTLGFSQTNISGRESRRVSRDPRSASGLCRPLNSVYSGTFGKNPDGPFLDP